MKIKHLLETQDYPEMGQILARFNVDGVPHGIWERKQFHRDKTVAACTYTFTVIDQDDKVDLSATVDQWVEPVANAIAADIKPTKMHRKYPYLGLIIAPEGSGAVFGEALQTALGIRWSCAVRGSAIRVTLAGR